MANVRLKYAAYPHRSAPSPLTAPASRPVRENRDDRNAYWRVAPSRSHTAMKNARKAAVPSPPENDSIAEEA